MQLKRLNQLDPRWSKAKDCYYVSDEGYLCKVLNDKVKPLKSGYFRDKKYPYQQVRSEFGSGKKLTIKVHYAVALAFCEKPNGAFEVDHINNIKTDNRAVNLRWVSHHDNIRKMFTEKGRTDAQVTFSF